MTCGKTLCCYKKKQTINIYIIYIHITITHLVSMSESPLKNIWNPFDGVTEDEDAHYHQVVVNQFHLGSFLVLDNLLRGLEQGYLEHNIRYSGLYLLI